jgi:hypothetical protein
MEILHDHYFTGHKGPLILLLRNYKECITRNIFSCHEKYNKEKSVTNDMIDKAFTEGENIDIATNYIRNIKIFDDWVGEKYILYYEDMKDEFYNLVRQLNLDYSALDWDKQLENSMGYYKHITKDWIYPVYSDSLYYHERFLENPEYMDKKILHEAGNYLYLKYLRHYETTIHTT